MYFFACLLFSHIDYPLQKTILLFFCSSSNRLYFLASFYSLASVQRIPHTYSFFCLRKRLDSCYSKMLYVMRDSIVNTSQHKCRIYTVTLCFFPASSSNLHKHQYYFVPFLYALSFFLLFCNLLHLLASVSY